MNGETNVAPAFAAILAGLNAGDAGKARQVTASGDGKAGGEEVAGFLEIALVSKVPLGGFPS